MKKKIAFRSLAVVAIVAMGQGCSSSGSSNPNGVNASSVSSAAGTFSALEGLLNTVNASSSSRLSARSISGGPQPGDPSLLGCHFKQDLDRTFREMKHIQAPLCYMSIVEKNDSDFVIPENSYGCFKLEGFQQGDSNKTTTAHFRVGIFTDENGRRTLKYQMVIDSEQTEDFRIAEIDGGVSAFTAHKETLTGFDGKSHEFQGSFEVSAYGETTDALTKADILAKFQDDFGRSFNHVTADRDAALATMLGYFGGTFNDFTNETGECVFASQGKGSGHVSSTATFLPYLYSGDGNYYCPNPDGPSTQVLDPAVPCPETTFDNEENFYITGNPAQCLIDGDPNADLVAKVSDCGLPTKAQSPAAFDVEWNGSCDSFVNINLTSLDSQFKESCAKFEDHHNDDFQSCEQQAAQGEHQPTPTPTPTP